MMIRLLLPKLVLLIGLLILVGALVTTVESSNTIRGFFSSTTTTTTESDEDSCWFLIGAKDDMYKSIDERRTVNLNLPEKCIEEKRVRIHVPEDGIRRSFLRTERSSSDLKTGNDTSTIPANYWHGEDTSDGSTFKFTRDKHGNVFASLTDATSHTVFEVEIESNSKTAYTRTHSTDVFLPRQIMRKEDDERNLNIDPNGVYIEVTTGVCETHGYVTLTHPEECIMATDALQRTVIWGREGEYRNVVTGCSMRFSYTSSTLVLFNQQGYCNPEYKMDDWTFTRCQCTVWMPCLCRNSGPVPSPADNNMPTDLEEPDFTLNVLNETERANLDTENGKIAIFSVEEINALFFYYDLDYSQVMTDGDIFEMMHIKENQGFVLRAKCERTGREDGLMIWSNSTHAFGSWNPRDSAVAGDFMDGDVLTLLDYGPLSFGRRIATSSDVTYSLSNDTTTEWNLPVEAIQFGHCGLIGKSEQALEVVYELEQAAPIWGVWSDSINLPYTVMFEDIFTGNWTVQKENCTGSETFPAAVFAKKWRIHWESTDISSSDGLSTTTAGGGLHAQLIIQYLVSGITAPSPSTASDPTVLLTPTTITQTSSVYIQVTSGVCGDHGYNTLTSLEDCMNAATELGQSGFISSSSQQIDVVTGCSLRFSVSSGTTLYFNEPGFCDPTQNVDEYTYTGCECTVWMPCICKYPASTQNSTEVGSSGSGSSQNSTEIVSFADIPEGAACVCDGDELERVYRFMNGELHLYPNATIATSWDENWREYQVTVDCASISFGEPLDMKIDTTPSPTVVPTLSPVSQTIGHIPDSGPANPGPSTELTIEPTPNDYTPAPNSDVGTGTGDAELLPGIPEGHATVCDGDTSQIFRWTNGKLHLYPTTEIANSWDLNWRDFVDINCTGLEFGDPMGITEFQAEIPEGRTVQCEEDTSKIYRWENGELRHFDSSAIASSWDESWRENLLVVDCSGLPIGTPMELNPVIADGKAVQCEGDHTKIFRYEQGVLYLYPSGVIASSWDETWRRFRIIDCNGLSFGDQMTMVSSYAHVSEGRTVQCEGDTSKLYRVTGGQLRHYSDAQIAYSWNLDWRNFIVIDCRFFHIGEPMEEYLNTPIEKKSFPLDQRYVEISDNSCEYYGHKSITSSEECTAAAIDMGLTILWGPYGGYRDVVTGCSTRFTISKQSLLHFNEPGVCDPNYNILDWAFTSCKCTVVMPCLCKNSLFGKVPAVPLEYIEEGQSCQCQKDDDGKIYRYAAGELHHYPSVEIALSWNENWRQIKVIDCDEVSIGSPMEINSLYHQTIAEGQSVLCAGDDEKLYRWTGNELRHYPTSTIALSWNDQWRDIKRDVDCSLLIIGEPMNLNPDYDVNHIPVGQSIQCNDGDGKLYRWMGDEDPNLRHYPTTIIALSWNENWKDSIKSIDCGNFTIGEPLDLFEVAEVGPQPAEESILGIPDNKAVQCEGDTSMTYAWINEELHHYPSTEIAETWGQDLEQFVVVNCTSLIIGLPMIAHSEIFPDAPDGQSVVCNDGSGRLYRWTENQLRYYPSGIIANSWDPNWHYAIYIDCTFLDHGPDMELYNPQTDGVEIISEGQSCICVEDPSKIYRYMNGELHHYPTSEIAYSWDPDWREALTIDCNGIPIGWPMDIMIPTGSPVSTTEFYSYSTLHISEGQAVQCDGDTTSLFRWEFGQLREYENVFIANSWDPNYNDYIVVDCTGLSFGPPMLLNSQVTSMIYVAEGTTIQCDGDFGKLYRWTNFVLRLYPNTSVAETWNENWREYILVDCSKLLFGPPMEPFTPFNIYSTQSSDICLIAESLVLSVDDVERSQELCPTSQWALTYFDEQYYVIMDRFASKLNGSAPGKCHCLAACISIEVLCEIECRQSLIGGSCKQACEAACTMCENNCVL